MAAGGYILAGMMTAIAAAIFASNQKRNSELVRIAKNAINARSRMSDSTFAEKCGLIYPSRQADVALKCRSFLAEDAGVNPECIYPDDRFEDELSIFSFADDFDTSTFLEKLTEREDLTIDWAKAQHIVQPDLPTRSPRRADVKMFVASALEAVSSE